MKYQAEDLSAFSKQIRIAVDRYKPHPYERNDIRNVVIAGLGGSGIAGRIARNYLEDEMKVPVEVVSEYKLPGYVGPESLVILSSYSGNTEETLSMYEDAQARGSKLIALSTGGKLLELAEKAGIPFYKADPGYQPRMALGYSLTYLLLILNDFSAQEFEEELLRAAAALENEEPFIKEAKGLMEHFPDKGMTIQVLCDRLTYPVALRFTQQVNENAKGEAFVVPLPETNHNVIESHTGKRHSMFIILNGHDHPRVDLRFTFLKSLLEEKENHVITLELAQKNLASYLELVYKLDWLSLLLADAKGINSAEIPNINRLKTFLKENQQA
ncbi:MAG: bifunctional phosphoglucose/phosphomannose isomerase [Bacteroidia bacterium]